MGGEDRWRVCGDAGPECWDCGHIRPHMAHSRCHGRCWEHEDHHCILFEDTPRSDLQEGDKCVSVEKTLFAWMVSQLWQAKRVNFVEASNMLGVNPSLPIGEYYMMEAMDTLRLAKKPKELKIMG